jgi:histidine triad (HIT) family protein
VTDLIKALHSHQPEDYACPFCQTVRGIEREDPWTKRSDVILQTETVTAFISPRWWPNNPGNVLVVPNEHYENIYSIPDELLYQVQSVGKRIAIAMKEGYHCDGTSFRQHNEPAGNQEVWHYHLHVFPRYPDDALYRSKGRITSPEERKPYAETLRRRLVRS